MKLLIGALCLLSTIQIYAAEGVNTHIDPARLQEVQAWLNNSKLELERVLSLAEQTPAERQEALYVNAIQKVLAASKGQNEFLMRNILYRTMEVYKVLPTTSEPKRNAVARRILKETIQKSLAQHQVDMSIYQDPKNVVANKFLRPVEFAVLGLEWSQYILSIHYLMPTNESRLASLEAALGLLYNDILDDSQYNRVLAPIASDIANFKASKQHVVATTSKEKLELSRELRAFLEREIQLASEIIKSVNIAKPQQSISSNNLAININSFDPFDISSIDELENYVIAFARTIQSRNDKWSTPIGQPSIAFIDESGYSAYFGRTISEIEINPLFDLQNKRLTSPDWTITAWPLSIFGCNLNNCPGDLVELDDPFKSHARVLALTPRTSGLQACLIKSGPRKDQIIPCRHNRGGQNKILKTISSEVPK